MDDLLTTFGVVRSEHEFISRGIEVITMGAASQSGTTADMPCGFPACERDRVTDSGMCQEHRRVVISSTGSWLEAS